MNFLDKALLDYIESHTSPEPPILQRLNRETYAKVLMPRMLSGHLQGRLLAMLSQMICPAAILEIGTFTGYSAICLAEGLREDGKLYTIDINEELEEMVRNFFKEAGVEAKIDYRIGNALDLIPAITASFDMVFIDADKINYNKYYDIIFDKVNKGGFIIADNVLWSGKVMGTPDKKIDADTQAIIDFNQRIQQDERVENVLLPVRDGLMIVRKK